MVATILGVKHADPADLDYNGSRHWLMTRVEAGEGWVEVEVINTLTPIPWGGEPDFHDFLILTNEPPPTWPWSVPG